jgi:hypothetical protein
MDAIFPFLLLRPLHSAQISTKGSLMVLVTINFKFIAFIAFRTLNEFADEFQEKKKVSKNEEESIT